MASTTKTGNLQLSQFVGTDKPAWLTDYNGDMQKIDAGYKELKDANADTQADLDLTKQSLTSSDADIADLKTEVQDLQAQDTKFTNDITVLSANYETMHHEMVNNETELAAVNTDLNKDVALETQASTVHEAINELALSKVTTIEVGSIPENENFEYGYIRITRVGYFAILEIYFKVKESATASGWTNLFDIKTNTDFLNRLEDTYSTYFYADATDITASSRLNGLIKSGVVQVWITQSTVPKNVEMRCVVPFLIWRNV